MQIQHLRTELAYRAGAIAIRYLKSKTDVDLPRTTPTAAAAGTSAPLPPPAPVQLLNLLLW